MEFLGTLCLVLITTSLAGHFSRRIGIPAVIGQLLVGILIGPAVLGWVHNNAFMHTFSEIGVIILMFIAGLESDLGMLKKYFKPALAVAFSGVVFPVVLIYFFGKLFHFSFEQAIFLGVTFSATSVSISVEVLKELKRLKSREGTTILGAAVIDDIISVIILSVLVSMFSNVAKAQGGHHSSNLWMSFLLDALYFVMIFFLFEWIAPKMMRLGEHLKVASSVTLMSIVLCLGMAWLAEQVGLSDVVGAFFAGVAIAQTPYKQEVDSNIEPIGYAVFIPMFFVSIGLNMTFKGFFDDLIFIVSLTILALITKWLGCGLGAKVLGMNYDSMNIIGSGMVSRGEMALIIAQIGYEAHLLSSEYYSGVIFVIILTTLAAPFMLKAAIKRQMCNEK
ncbi:cation:proton antiporter [Ligilactobacillus aviarius]|uniref:Sodium:proton antiporter n=1 Tax=Ligilactobacillus aviarius TaxID=1606 RepID=A0A179CTT6_9LACO|nr:cation:proton antiporter [Ligilactobacillus aviarius]OAP98967.1 sodium:proton antiporter [Ligilactobacillus aviarius]OAP99404.1 sodium:proton antiporter [Ligilactobacillus aviarius]OAQ01439.1 sodium:proton antiporter [Ligilactobacillus aviarius]OAQ04918.1 sodium:proton antiporter [Ligilactobacillus aviarius]OAQ08881.1 sodium:proton antiporter [Ligilactobacillus aviarius]